MDKEEVLIENEKLKVKNAELIMDNGKLTMNNWEEKKIQELGKVIRGVTYKKDMLLDEESPNSITLLRANNIQENLDLTEIQLLPKAMVNSDKIIQNKDILFCMSSGSKHLVGKNIVLENLNNYSFGAFCSVLRCQDKRIVDFIKYFFKSDLFKQKIKLFSKGVNIQNLKGSQLEKIRIPLPPLPEQRRIVSKLDALFAEIDASLALIDQNIEQAEALKLSVLDEEFSMDDEGVKISGLIEKTKNLKPKKEFPDEQFTYLDISSVNKENKVIEEPKILKGKEAPSRAKKEVQKGDVLFATTRPNLRNIAVVENDYDKPIASTGFCLLRTIPDKLFNRYLFYFLLTNTLQNLIEPFIRGAQYPAISDRNLKGLKIPLPDLKTQQKIVQKLDSIFEEIDGLVNDYKQKRENLEALKSSILDQAFKGEL